LPKSLQSSFPTQRGARIAPKQSPIPRLGNHDLTNCLNKGVPRSWPGGAHVHGRCAPATAEVVRNSWPEGGPFRVTLDSITGMLSIPAEGAAPGGLTVSPEVILSAYGVPLRVLLSGDGSPQVAIDLGSSSDSGTFAVGPPFNVGAVTPSVSGPSSTGSANTADSDRRRHHERQAGRCWLR
jgi:hypothetical protein